MKFGLSDAVLADLCQVFSAYPQIEQVLIFGSRAKNTFKDGSDIDLAVFAPNMSAQHFSHLWNALDDLPLVFKMDVLYWDQLGHARLKQKILIEGQVLYPCP